MVYQESGYRQTDRQKRQTKTTDERTRSENKQRERAENKKQQRKRRRKGMNTSR